MVRWRGKESSDSTGASTMSSKTIHHRSIATKLESRLLSRSAYYTVIFLFVLQNLLQFWWGAVEEAHHQHDDYRKYTIPIARGAGYMINFNMVLLILFGSRFLVTALRKTVLNVMFPFDKAMPQFHMIIGYVLYVSAAVHGVFHVIPGIIANHWERGFGGWTFCVVTGTVIFAIFSVMLFTAREKTRNKNFELFYYIHIGGAFLFIVLLFLHGNFRRVLYTYKWISAPVFLYVVDRIVRKLREHRGYVNVSSRSTPNCGGGIFRLSVPKCFDYKAGQYAEIKVPSISKHQWHPFTIASAPHEEEMVFYIKAKGGWTRKLEELIENLKGDSADSSGNISGQNEAFKVHVRGPYGAPTQHTDQYRSIVLISGGVGSTPFCSVTKSVAKYVEERAIQRKTESDDEGDAYSSELTTSSSTTIGPHESLTKATVADIGQSVLEDPSAYSAYRQSFAEPHSHVPFQSLGGRLGLILNSVTAQTALLWILAIRLWLVFLAGSMKETFLTNSPGFRTATNGFMAADLGFLVVFTVLLVPSILVDYTMLTRYAVIDSLLLLPIVLMNIAGHILGLAGVGADNSSTEAWPYVYYFVIFPIGIILYIWRYIRLVGEMTIIAPAVGYKNRETHSLDFIWTAPTANDDAWLVKELEPYAYSKHLRLHRFLTRESADPEDGGIAAGLGRFSNNYGRPDWNQVFETLVMNSKSYSTIGVFFCGPKAMEDQVHKAAINAMVNSTRRGHMYCAMPNSKKRRRGCYVRLTFRQENF